MNMLCEKCGGAMEVRREGSTQGLYCTQCDWAVVTTVFPEIKKDMTQYEVRVTQGDVHNDGQIKAVASAAGVNFLAARRLLGEREPLVYSGRAIKVLEVKNSLESAGLTCVISPAFIYS
ncbi:MAG: hypothetical protein JF600_03210 [Xanthomonadales bacterium]|nr:hypothetical protein [Xanthomonadales bacterium]